MAKYGVSVVFCVSKYIEVEANSKEEAEEIAEEQCSVPTLCHQCSDEVGSDLNYMESVATILSDLEGAGE